MSVFTLHSITIKIYSNTQLSYLARQLIFYVYSRMTSPPTAGAEARLRSFSSDSAGSGSGRRSRTFSSGSGYGRAVLLAIDASETAKHAFDCK